MPKRKTHAPKRRPGAPSFEPTEYQRGLVYGWAVSGKTNSDIADRLSICENTLAKHFGEELRQARTELEPEAVGVIIKALRAGGKEALTAAFFLLKTKYGWRETHRQEVDAKISGGTINVIIEQAKA